MTEPLYSKQEYAQWRGPSTSDNYNERVENLYKDLMTILNRIGLSEENIRMVVRRMLKEQFALTHTLLDLEERINILELGDTSLTFGNPETIDDDAFASTDFAIPEDARLTWDGQHSVFTLPRDDSASFSKLKMVNADGSSVIPSSFEAKAQGVTGTADSNAATLDTSDIYHAVLQSTGLVWERNVLVDSPDVDGATVVLYIRFPTDLVVTENTNAIVLHPFPATGCDIVAVEYTTDPDVAMNDSDAYLPINEEVMYSGVTESIGWSPPGAWVGDTEVAAGPRIYHFNPGPLTGIRVTLHQDNYYAENSKYVYTYGLSSIDARYEKFADVGRTILRFEAPEGETISDVTNILPSIFNVLEAEVPNIFDYRVIWETYSGSGVYTIDPVPLSERVWIEVTLRKTFGKGTPMLSRLKVEYT